MKQLLSCSILRSVAWIIVLLMQEPAGFALDSRESGRAGIPVPPEQSKPWTPPPTKMPPMVVSAMIKLFDEGLADPRGCEYREIEITAGLGEGDVKTHGWVLPEDGKEFFAVTWSGVVYPLKSAGSPADLEKDVADLLVQDQKTWGHYAATNADIRGHYRTNEWMAITNQSLLPLKAALLFRLAHSDLAESVWKEWFFSNADQAAQDPYVLLAREWLEVAYDQALFAHMWGDDSLALAGFRKLEPLQKEVEASAAKRGIAKAAQDKPYLEGFEQLPALLSDQERRAQEQPYLPVLKSGLPAQGPERIAALIRDLELVSARQEMNPGATEVINDPIVQALIQEGDLAVEPLIKCLEEDNRLTRSLFTFHMMGRGPMIPVYEPAYVALVAILKVPFFIDLPNGKSPRELSQDERNVLASKIRFYWDKNKKLTLPERWFATLQDDNAGATAWFQAVDNIMLTTDQSSLPRNLFNYGGGGWGHAPGTPVTCQGESLRNKSNPSVSDLMVKRARQILAQKNPDSDKTFGLLNERVNNSVDTHATFEHLGNLLGALANWDGKAHFDDLRKLTGDLKTKYPDQGSSGTLTTIYEKWAVLGDPQALVEYAAWLSTLDPDRTESPAFRLMWQHPSDPTVQKAAEQLFQARNSSWRLAPPKPPRFACDLISTPLIGLPVFRQSLFHALEDTTMVGDLFVNWEGTLLDGKVRFCDYVALRLSNVEEFPEMKFEWPEKQRNAVVERCKMLLQNYGDNYRYGPQDEDQNPEPPRSQHTAIAFAPLDHPATPEDVTHGRAIFSLTGTTRVCKMPPFPIPAQRPGLPQDPVRWSGDNGITYTYDTSGKVWQAEEVQVDGKWQRYYGFAGRHQLEKVPASEIVFPRNYEATAVTEYIDTHLDGPEAKMVKSNLLEGYAYTTLGSPLSFTIKARNHGSFDQAIPGELVLVPNAGKLLPSGITFSLSYSEQIPPEVLNPMAQPAQVWGLGAFATVHRFDYGKWQDVPLQKEVQAMAPAQAPGPILTPTQELIILRVDLRDYFDTSRPGSYRLTALFHMPGQPEAKSNEVTFSITAAPH